MPREAPRLEGGLIVRKGEAAPAMASPQPTPSKMTGNELSRAIRESPGGRFRLEPGADYQKGFATVDKYGRINIAWDGGVLSTTVAPSGSQTLASCGDD